jgi:hypothetical protein
MSVLKKKAVAQVEEEEKPKAPPTPFMKFMPKKDFMQKLIRRGTLVKNADDFELLTS